jgi:hypothetical protein
MPVLGTEAGAALLLVGVHQIGKPEYTGENGLTRLLLPVMIPVQSALSSSPKARASSEKIFEIFGGGGCGARSRKHPKARQIISLLPYRLGLTLRCQRTRCASKASWHNWRPRPESNRMGEPCGGRSVPHGPRSLVNKLVEAVGVEPTGMGFADPASNLAAPISVTP